ncbi:glycoside hydrolase family 18 protein [Rhodofomes roseus]|uniref:Glycoside hydrolase family 18 protein n=1 Tax=Rhodofomes roseus TaxID=34475 RepID=A0ABQ8K951_9APHY|nr:glycoside hydrolase family 18 protein [Rhodofomes roseus]KAH9833837.1 glycoside hydrolase family 18 protein [Rhodofomes roseus]
MSVQPAPTSDSAFDSTSSSTSNSTSVPTSISDSKSTLSSTPDSTPSSTSRSNSTPKSGAYYPSWATADYAPSKLEFSQWDILFYAFAAPSSSNGVDLDSGDASTLKSLVSAAHASNNKTKVVLSIGGWGNCKYYSQIMGSSNSRDLFVDAVVQTYNDYNLDGIDIDWEFPNDDGAGDGQGKSPDDAANLLTFFQALRAKLGNDAIISAAVTDQPFKGPDGNPLSDVSDYAKVMTYVNLMNYDTVGASSTPGPNAPLGDLCGTSTHKQSSAQAGLKQWTDANFPANQLMLGLPLYGYVSKSSKTELQERDVNSDGSDKGKGSSYLARVLALGGKQYAVSDDVRDGNSVKSEREYSSGDDDLQAVFVNGVRAGQLDPSANQTAELARSSGSGDLGQYMGQQIAFGDIVALGALQYSGGKFTAANGYTLARDNCSGHTPFLYDTSRETVVTYDDPTSLALKAQFVASSGMAGAFTWSLDQDYGNYVLQNAIRVALGLTAN